MNGEPQLRTACLGPGSRADLFLSLAALRLVQGLHQTELAMRSEWRQLVAHKISISQAHFVQKRHMARKASESSREQSKLANAIAQ